MLRHVFFVWVVLSVSACSGMRSTDTLFSAHAENFNILFLQIPSGDNQQRAMDLVPENAEIKTIESSPEDLTSFAGVFNRILGVGSTRIDGTISQSE